ncbi:SDR family oxidoreductase [Nocardiopsis coralliicola]
MTPRLFRLPASDGLPLAVRSYGDPEHPTLLCVHGYPDDSRVWEGVAVRLAERYHVVAYDVRGAGRSPAPESREGYTLDRLAADMAAVARAAGGGRPVHLLAHDWGSIAAWHTVSDPASAPLFASFTSISGPSLDSAGAWLRAQLRPSPRRLRAFADQMARSGYIGFFHLPAVPEAAWYSGVGSAVLAGADLLGRPAAAPAARRSVRGHINGLELYRANFGRRMRRPELRRTPVPVQVLVPAAELFMSEALQRAAAEWAPDFRFHRVAGGHWMPRTRPEAVAGRVEAFHTDLERRNAGAPPAAVRAAGAAAPPAAVRPDARPLTGQVAVVVGAGSGIGRAVALELAARGARVACADAAAGRALQTARHACARTAGAVGFTLDARALAPVEAFADRVRAELGVPDIVVNAAAADAGAPSAAPGVPGTGGQGWGAAAGGRADRAVGLCRAFARQMVEAGLAGRIVNTVSPAAWLPSPARPEHAAEQAAVAAASRSLRADLAQHGVKVVTAGTPHTGGGSRGDAVARRTAAVIADGIDRAPDLLPATPAVRATALLARLSPAALRAAARLSAR